MQAPSSTQPALLLIDMQVGLFDGPEQPHAAIQLITNIQTLITRARAAQVPIFAARHSGPLGSPIAPGSPLWQLLPELGLSEASDTLFNKYRPSCFQGTDLAERLAAADIGQLYIAGLKTQFCVDTSCRAASERGLTVTLLADAHSCMDTPQLTAAQIIQHHNATLAGPFVRLCSTQGCHF